MRQRERRILDSQSRSELRGASVKADGRASPRHAHDLTIAPADAVIPARAQRLHRGLLGGKARGVPLDPICLGITVADFSGSKNALHKAFSEALDRMADARNFGDIDARPD